MQPHPLTTSTPGLVERHGVPQVLEVEHSIQAHRPTLTGSVSPASHYLRAPAGMTAEALIQWFESVPGFPSFNLTLVATLGLDTYHQPLISTDDFAKKYFHDNHFRIVRVVGKSDAAIEAMEAFVEALKRPFDASQFPQHAEFAVSGYRSGEPGRATELKLLYKPAEPTLLMKVERVVNIHLDEWNLGREIGTSRHSTRNQPPELILTSTSSAPAGLRYLDALASSLPRATPEDIAAATERSQRSAGPAKVDGAASTVRLQGPQVSLRTLSPLELRKKAMANLAEILKGIRFAGGAPIELVQAGTALEVKFPRIAASLWFATSFSEGKHIREITSSCVGVRADPMLRNGWSAHYNFDSKTGKLQVRAVDPEAEPPEGWKVVPFVD